MAGISIEHIPIGELIPYIGNARKHNDQNVSAIASSIAEYGFNDPIAINEKDSVIIEGHGRLLAAKKLRLQTVPVIKLGHLTEAQIKGYTLIHNRLAEKSEWDNDILELELDKLAEFDVDLDDFGFDIEGLGFDDSEPKNKNKELDFNDFDGFQHTCPKCKFEWNDK